MVGSGFKGGCRGGCGVREGVFQGQVVGGTREGVVHTRRFRRRQYQGKCSFNIGEDVM